MEQNHFRMDFAICEQDETDRGSWKSKKSFYFFTDQLKSIFLLSFSYLWYHWYLFLLYLTICSMFLDHSKWSVSIKCGQFIPEHSPDCVDKYCKEAILGNKSYLRNVNILKSCYLQKCCCCFRCRNIWKLIRFKTHTLLHEY